MDHRGMVGRIYKEDHYTLLLTKYESSGPCGFGEEDFLCFPHCKSIGANDPQGGTISNPRGMVGMIYKEDHYMLLLTKYESSGPCGFGEEDFFYVFPMTPPGWGLYGPQGHGWQVYEVDHYTMLHTKYESSGPCDFGEEDFLMFYP